MLITKNSSGGGTPRRDMGPIDTVARDPCAYFWEFKMGERLTLNR